MSRENVEIVRRIYDAFLSADFEAAFTALDPEICWDLTHHDWPGEDTYTGHDGVLAVLSEWMGSFDDYQIEIEDIVDAGERVVVIQRERAVHRHSATPIDRRTASVYTIENGRAVRIDHYLEPREALEAAGVG